jgi:hypothetical protein
MGPIVLMIFALLLVPAEFGEKPGPDDFGARELDADADCFQSVVLIFKSF